MTAADDTKRSRLITHVVDQAAAGQTFMLSLGGAFTGVWFLGLAARPAERHPWPLFAAAPMLTVGLSLLTRTPVLIDLALAALAAGLLVWGVIAVVRRGQ